MKLLFKQRLFSWFDSYDIYDEASRVIYTVKGELSWGHLLRIYDAQGRELGYIKQEIWSFLPQFHMYLGDRHIGHIYKEFSLFTPKYNIDYKDWHVEGDWAEWDYSIYSGNGSGQCVATISKEVFNWTDTYVINIYNPDDALNALMLVLAIDAEKCSRDN